jgi:hypothetical protein
MDKLEQLKQKIESIQAKSAVAPEMKQFITLVLSVIVKSKQELENLSDENIKTIKDSIAYIEKNYENKVSLLDEKINTAKGNFDTNIAIFKDLITELKSIKYKDGADGKDADEEVIVEKVLGKIKLPDYKETVLDNGEEIVAKINELSIIPENQIDASHIKNLPEIVQKEGAKGRIVRVYTDETTITGDGSVSNPLTLTGGSEDLWDRTGTTLTTHNFGDAVYLGETTGFSGVSNIPFQVGTNTNNYSGMYLQNLSNGDSASADVIIGNDIDGVGFIGHYKDDGIQSSGFSAASFGVISTISLSNGGTGYTAGDTLTISTGDGNATFTVETESGGVVQTVLLISNGTGYSVSSDNATTGGTGNNDCTINILSLIDTTLLTANDIYSIASGGNYLLGTDGGVAGKKIKFFTGGTASYNQRIEIGDTDTSFLTSYLPSTTPTFIPGNWTGTNGWSASGTQLVKVTNATAGTITPSGAGATPVVGNRYKITIVCSAKGAAAITYTYGGVAGTTIIQGTITDYITASTTGKLIITGAVSSTATIDSVLIEPIDDSIGDIKAYGSIKLAGELTGLAGLGGLSVSPTGITYNRGAFINAGAMSGVTTLAIAGGFSGATTIAHSAAISGSIATLFVPTIGIGESAASAATGLTAALIPIQYSPSIRLLGYAWNATGTPASNNYQQRNWLEPYTRHSGTGTITGRQKWETNIAVNATAEKDYLEIMSLGNTGGVDELNVLGQTLSAENLTNPNFDNPGTGWTVAGGAVLGSNALTYTHNAAQGSVLQANATMAVALKANRWYRFTYTTSAPTITVRAYIDETYTSSERVYLPGVTPASGIGQQQITFKTNSNPTGFKISFTSAVGAITFDTFSLKEIQSGNIVANGLFTGGGTTGIKVDNLGNVAIGREPLTTTTFFTIRMAADRNLGIRYNASSTDIYAVNDANSAFQDLTFNGSTKFTSNGYIELNGNAARSLSMIRHTTANTAGNNFTVQGGGATLAATDKNGGDLILSSGISTGTGTSKLSFYTATAGTTGTADNTPTVKMTILGNGNTGVNSTTPLSKFEVIGTVGNVIPERSVSTLTVIDDTAQTTGVGGSIVFTGKYADAGTVLGGGPYIKAYKTNSTTGDYGFGLAFGTRTNGVGAAATRMTIDSIGNVGIGVTQTAVLHLKAGTATASTAPLKFTSGTLLGTTEGGTIEYNGTHLYFTATDAGTRYQLDQQSGVPALTATQIPFGDGSNLMTSSADMTWDSTNKFQYTAGGFMATGAYGSGWTEPNLGAGTRMFWYPKVASFRAGTVNGTQWNDANIGAYSFGFGQNPLVSGYGAIGMGVNGVQSTGDVSIAMGNVAKATANGAVAIGNGPQATAVDAVAIGVGGIASGNASTALGYYTKAEAYATTVIGRYNVGGGTAGSWVDTDSIFEIGIGASSGAKANALTVLKNGKSTFSSNLATTMQSTTLAASATAIAVTSNVVKVTGDAGANTVATITGGINGQTLILIFVDALVTITDTAAATANTVNLSAAFTSAANTTLSLVYDGNKWFETARSVNG